jgi:hypothetical protein
MSCKVTGTSPYDYNFSSHSGKSSQSVDCTIQDGATGIKHIVTVTPTRKRYHLIRVTGRIAADPIAANANFHGPTVMGNKIEWQEKKPISTLSITFRSAEIRFVTEGDENIETEIAEQNRWKPNDPFNQIDQNDMIFKINLSA